MMKTSLLTSVVFLSTSFCLADTTQTAADPGVTFTLTPYTNFAARADLGDANGSISVFRAGTTFTVGTPVTSTTEIKVALQGEYSHYSFRNLSAVADSEHDSFDGQMYEIRPSFNTRINDNLVLFGGALINAAGDSGARWGDAFTYGAYAGVSYKINDNLYVGGGLGFTTKLEDNTLILPIGSLTWNFADDWSLTSDGLGARVTYKIDSAWSAFVDAHYTFNQFRLAPNDVIPNGALFDQAIPVTVGVAYKPSDALSISANVGAVVWRRVEFWTAGGNQAGGDEANPAAYGSLQLTWAF